MDRIQGDRAVTVENQKKAVEILRSRAIKNLQESGQSYIPNRRSCPSNSRGLSTKKINGKAIDIPEYILDKFFSRVHLDGECICLKGKNAFSGYSVITINNKRILGHRFSYLFFVGPINSELVIDHLCRNRGCINPEHLDQKTHQQNIVTGVSPAAKHYAKTHCIKGHPFSSENTYRSKFGRQCRICRKITRRKAYEKERMSKGNYEF